MINVRNFVKFYCSKIVFHLGILRHVYLINFSQNQKCVPLLEFHVKKVTSLGENENFEKLIKLCLKIVNQSVYLQIQANKQVLYLEILFYF